MSEPAPALHVLDDGGAGVGRRLAEARRRSGQSLEQAAAATRIRRHHLEALEREDLAALPGPVYAHGYLRTYAEHLRLDAAALLAELAPLREPAEADARVGATRRRLSLGGVAPAQLPDRLALTGPVLAAAGLVVVGLLFGAYAWREVASARSDSAAVPTPAAAAAAPPIASPQPLPSLDPAAGPAAAVPQVFVAVKAAEPVWLSVTVDGKTAYGGFLQPGQELTFLGRRVKLAAGKPSLLVATGGADYRPLGVLTKEYSADT